MDTVKKRKRHVRQAEPKPIRLQSRDIDIMEMVYRFKVLSQAQIKALFFGSSATNAQSRLARLFDLHYLDRKFLPMQLGVGRSPTLYVLARRGVELLRTERGYDSLKWFSDSTDFSDTFLQHTLAINEVYVAVALACRAHGFTLESWQTENEVKADYDYVTLETARGKREQFPVVPDSVFSIVAHGRRHRCLLELDRGTMESARFKDKVRAYIAYHTSGKYQARYGSQSMRVLTVISTISTGEKRLANLKAATEAVGGKRHFWFTTLKQITPQAVFDEAIWQLASENVPRPLIEPPNNSA
jgi:hypothetical protein